MKSETYMIKGIEMQQASETTTSNHQRPHAKYTTSSPHVAQEKRIMLIMAAASIGSYFLATYYLISSSCMHCPSPPGSTMLVFRIRG